MFGDCESPEWDPMESLYNGGRPGPSGRCQPISGTTGSRRTIRWWKSARFSGDFRQWAASKDRLYQGPYSLPKVQLPLSSCGISGAQAFGHTPRIHQIKLRMRGWETPDFRRLKKPIRSFLRPPFLPKLNGWKGGLRNYGTSRTPETRFLEPPLRDFYGLRRDFPGKNWRDN